MIARKEENAPIAESMQKTRKIRGKVFHRFAIGVINHLTQVREHRNHQTDLLGKIHAARAIIHKLKRLLGPEATRIIQVGATKAKHLLGPEATQAEPAGATKAKRLLDPEATQAEPAGATKAKRLLDPGATQAVQAGATKAKHLIGPGATRTIQIGAATAKHLLDPEVIRTKVMRSVMIYRSFKYHLLNQ